MVRAKNLALITLLLGSAFGQNAMFSVKGSAKGYSESEAIRAYFYATDALRVDTHHHDPITPTFTLYLGADKDGIDLDKHELYLRKWNRPLFEQGVLHFSIDSLRNPAYLAELVKRCEAQQNASVDVKSLQH